MNAGRPERDEASVATGGRATSAGGLTFRDSAAVIGYGEERPVMESQRRSEGNLGCL